MKSRDNLIRDFRAIYLLSFFLLLLYFYILPITDFLINEETFQFVGSFDHHFLKNLLGGFNPTLFMTILAVLCVIFFIVGYLIAKLLYYYIKSKGKDVLSALFGGTIVATMPIFILIQGYSIASNLYLISASGILGYSFLSYVMGVLFFGIVATGGLKLWKRSI